jgi:site-specific recombinase XerD
MESEMKFRVAAEDFLRYCTFERCLSNHTIQAYHADLADFQKRLSYETTLSEITVATLKSYLESLVDPRKLAASTIRRRFACLRAFFRRATGIDRSADPFKDWRPILPRRKRLPRTLSRAEASNLLQSCNSKLLRGRESDVIFQIIVRTLVVTGMRVGELCKLMIEDISPDCSLLRIQGKGARDRIAYITDTGLRRDLHHLLELRGKSPSESRRLFLNRFGAPMRPQSVRSSLRRVAQEANLSRRITPHMLRHTAATLLLETGVDIRFVQRLLGHSSIATTEIYTHVSDEALRSTLQRADVLGGLAIH